MALRLIPTTLTVRLWRKGGVDSFRSHVDWPGPRRIRREHLPLEVMMLLRAWRFMALLLTALSLTMESAHVLELPQKMRYDAVMYAAVNGTLYRYFAIVGGVYQITAIVLVAALAFLVRKRRPSFHYTLASAVCLGLAFVIWLVAVAPVNAEVAEAMRTTPQWVSSVWMEQRQRWEYGHVAGFVAQLVGLCALIASVLVETPRDLA